MPNPTEIDQLGSLGSFFTFLLLPILQLFVWVNFFSNRQYSIPFGAVGISIVIFVLCQLIYYAIRIARGTKDFTWVMGFALLNAFLVLLVAFAGFYWRFGTTANFNVTLSRLDALYFALGTLSTAGTGSITPISQLARGLVSIQMILDLMLVAVATTIVIARLSEWIPKSTPPTGALMQVLTNKTASDESVTTSSKELSSSPPANLPKTPNDPKNPDGKHEA
jgi:voltage-gated potassium channel